MLVITRKLGERIYIGPDIVLTVVDVGPTKVRIGIECPREVPIYRNEPPREGERRAPEPDPN